MSSSNTPSQTPSKSKGNIPPPPPITYDLTFETSQVRKGLELEGAIPQYPKALRASLGTKELLSLQERATAGTDKKVCMLKYENLKGAASANIEKFQNHVDMETFCTDVCTQAIKFDFAKLLTEFPVLDEPTDPLNPSDRFRNKKTVNLVKQPDQIGKTISLQEIGDTIEWIRSYASMSSAIFLQDLQWSHEYLMNCCDDELRESIVSDINHDFRPSQSGGPLTFALIITKTINLSEDAIDGLKQQFETFDLKTVPGEDIQKVVRYFMYACIRLENNDSMTPGFITTLFKAFQTSSCDEFNAIISQWRRDIKLQRVKNPTYKVFLKEVERIYVGMYFNGDWNGTAIQTDSGFVADKGNINKGRNDFSNPTNSDLVSSNPDCFQRTMANGKVFKWCDQCHRNLKFGRWTTSHFTHQHSGPKKEEVLRREAEKKKQQDQANLANKSDDSGKTNGTKDEKKTSFSHQLSESMSNN